MATQLHNITIFRCSYNFHRCKRNALFRWKVFRPLTHRWMEKSREKKTSSSKLQDSWMHIDRYMHKASNVHHRIRKNANTSMRYYSSRGWFEDSSKVRPHIAKLIQIDSILAFIAKNYDHFEMHTHTIANSVSGISSHLLIYLPSETYISL